ncbi:uncharacterized protein K452DRAFT_238153 [Aplosporella prunicola CBS 121167]|uniref:Enoyl reductase (ER) domain-containing protein n=1 Tax=Aplosporella prunicola CBS 121167 TaxID=1176127 RepID=A0A6A6AXU5_9PEZI|nr:uncharacterized protein K452DRAFT_238153 [Aplosporella prunicola CBS 121167]KAF2136068.1 hypothetical protein K452DRAFT_238153 [Aplosporella prunicola CBS 121167]
MSTEPRIPRLQRALVATGPGTLAMKSVPLPPLEPDQVLIRTAAVALNPSDYKLLDQSTTAGATSGSDYAGTVVRIGAEVTRKDLDIGANSGNPANGAFSQFVVAPADLCIRMPNYMTFEMGAAMGMGVMTVGLAFRSLQLHFRDNQDFNAGQQQQHVLVHGGATATGTMAIQMLRLSGYLPIVTCSPRNFQLVASRGAVKAFDYNSPTCRDEIKEYTKNKLAYVLDCIGNAATMTLCYGALGDGGGHYTALEQYPRRLTIRRRNVSHDWVLGWTLFGKPVELAGAYRRPALPEDRAFSASWVRLVEAELKQRLLEPHPLELHKGGLAAVVPRIDSLRRGKVSGKKLVFAF